MVSTNEPSQAPARLPFLPHILRPSAVGFGFLALAVFATSSAQETSWVQGESSASYPELAPLGVRTGSFLIFPKLTLRGLYDDNVFATERDKQSGLRYEVSPEFALRSDWGSHALNLLARAEIGRNPDFPSEDYEDWELSAGGRLDVRRDVKLYGGGGLGRNHIDRTAPDDARGLTPTVYDWADAFLGYSQSFGRFSLRIDGSATHKDFQDVLAIRDGQVVESNQDDRDRTEFLATTRIGYDIMPSFETFLRFGYDNRAYDNLNDITNTDRSSEGFEVVAGLAVQLDDVIFGDLFAGYRKQEYKDPFPDLETPVLGLELNWRPTGLTTVNLLVRQSIRETFNSRFSGYIRTAAGIGFEHELLRNLLINAGLTSYRDRYEGIGSARRDDTAYDFFVGPTYLVNRTFSMSAQYRFFRRDTDNNVLSSKAVDSFEKNLFLIQFQLHL